MRWPWQPKPEKRQTAAGSYTDTLIAGLLAQAEGTIASDVGATAAVEIAAGLWSRALASARVTPANTRTRAITPEFLAIVGREYIRRGESVHMLAVSEAGTVRLVPASTWDVWGDYSPESWLYRLDLEGPSGNRSRTVASAGVVHARFAVEPRRPWQGLPPTAYARSTGALLANLEQRLGQEAGGPTGHVIPVPEAGVPDADSGHDPLAIYREQIGKLNGKIALVETTSGGFGEGMSGAPRTDWKPQRLGAQPPAPAVELRSEAAASVLAACGVPLALVTDADGTAQREAYRRFAMAALEPVAAILARELAEKLDTPVQLDFRALWAHDMAGRAQAFEKPTSAGVERAPALALAGIG